METKNFDNAQMTALGKLGNFLKKEIDAAESPETGEHFVDFLVHVKGSLLKGEDFSKQVPQTAKPWLLFAVALSKLNGVTVDSIVKEAMSFDAKQEKTVKEQAISALTKIKGTTVKEMKGQVRFGKKFEVKLVADANDVADLPEVDVA
jgi:hypothetical protein